MDKSRGSTGGVSRLERLAGPGGEGVSLRIWSSGGVGCLGMRVWGA